jgi:hypothetical protein
MAKMTTLKCLSKLIMWKAHLLIHYCKHAHCTKMLWVTIDQVCSFVTLLVSGYV